jgi:hypothetical protein
MFLANLFGGQQGGFDISKRALQRTHEETLCIPGQNIHLSSFIIIIIIIGCGGGTDSSRNRCTVYCSEIQKQ